MHIFIFNRGLRLSDNTTLIRQINELGNVVPIFIFTPEQIDPNKNLYFSNNSVQFMIESLHELSSDIKKRNGKMYFFKGDNIKVLTAIHKKEKIESIGMNFDYTPYARLRSEAIQQFCKINNIQFLENEDYLLHDILKNETKKKDGTPYLVFTPFRNYCIKNLKVREPDKFNSFKFHKVSNLETNKYYLEEKQLNDFYEDNPNINVHGGSSNGIKILNSLDHFKDYQQKRDILTYKTTCLGAHMHFMTISIRNIYYSFTAIKFSKIKLSERDISDNLVSEFYWRDFYANITYEFPYILRGQTNVLQLRTAQQVDCPIAYGVSVASGG